MAEVEGGVYALGVGTTGIAPPPSVIQSLPSSSRCPLAILLLVVSLLNWSRFPLAIGFPLPGKVAMVPPPPSFVGVLGVGAELGGVNHCAFALGPPFLSCCGGGPGIEAKRNEVD